MKEFDYVPRGLENEDGERISPFKGCVKIKVPNFKERADLAKKVNLKLNADGSVDKSKIMDSLGTLYDVVSEHVVAVDLKFGEEHFKSLDDVTIYKEGGELINEISHLLMNGLSLSGK